MSIHWRGVMPAITTAFNKDLTIDYGFIRQHCRWLAENGCTGIVTPGSLGEGATLTFEEKVRLWKTCVKSISDRVPVIGAISSLSTADAARLAKSAADSGCTGLMVLPPYIYCGDWREMKGHVSVVFEATKLSCMLYNNPVAYGTDFLPEQICELAKEHRNLHAVKESSMDVRRITSIRILAGERLAVFVGVDDTIVEGIKAGAVGWIAGLANALPKESVKLFNDVLDGEDKKANKLYKWFLPLLRMDTVPKFVQLIKLVQEEVGMGNRRVRPPRLEVVGEELAATRKMIRAALNRRPKV